MSKKTGQHRQHRQHIETLIIQRINHIGLSPVIYRDFLGIRSEHQLNKRQITEALNALAERRVLCCGRYGVNHEPCWFWDRSSLENFIG